MFTSLIFLLNKYFLFFYRFVDFSGFTEVNLYSIHWLWIFKFSIQSNPRIGFLHIRRIEQIELDSKHPYLPWNNTQLQLKSEKQHSAYFFFPRNRTAPKKSTISSNRMMSNRTTSLVSITIPTNAQITSGR